MPQGQRALPRSEREPRRVGEGRRSGLGLREHPRGAAPVGPRRSVGIVGDQRVLDPGDLRQPAADLHVRGRLASPRGRRERDPRLPCGGQHEPGVAAAGDRDHVGTVRPVGQRAGGGGEECRRAVGVEAGAEKRRQPSGGESGAAASHARPERMALERPSAPDHGGQRRRVQVAGPAQVAKELGVVGQPVHPVNLGLVDRVRAHRVGQHVELAAGVVAADRHEAPVERGAVGALQEEARVDRAAAVGLAVARPADRTA